MKPEGYYVFRSPTNNIWSGQRGLDPDKAKAAALLGQIRNYPYAERDNAKNISTEDQPETYYIRDGIVCVPRGAEIPDNTVIPFKK